MCSSVCNKDIYNPKNKVCEIINICLKDLHNYTKNSKYFGSNMN